MAQRQDVKELIRQAALKTMREAGQIIRNRAVMNVTGRVLKRQTGRLATSITSIVRSNAEGPSVKVGTNVFYGAAWERGFTTKAHDIIPVKAKALRFVIGGTVLFRRRVHKPQKMHPARPWLRPAFEASIPDVKKRMSINMKAALGVAFPRKIELVIR